MTSNSRKAQKGSVKTIMLVAVLPIITMLILAIGGFIVLYVQYNDEAARLESSLEAAHNDAQNVYGNYAATMKEIAQVPDMYSADLEKIVRADVEGRYGADGSKAMMQWIQERQLPFDATLYSRIQDASVAGRREFSNAQTRMLDTKRVYQVALESTVSGFFLRLAGRPKLDLSKYNMVVHSHAQEAFRTGTDTEVKLR